MRIAIIEMEHMQPSTSEFTYSAIGDGFFNNDIQQQYCVRNFIFYWVWDRVRQGKYLVYWVAVEQNMVDYFTKNHPKKHHLSVSNTT